MTATLPPSPSAQEIVDRLVHTAAVLRDVLGAYIADGQHAGVDCYGHDGKPEVMIHDTAPITLKALELRTDLGDVQPHVDADGILRWVTLELPTITVTWHRR